MRRFLIVLASVALFGGMLAESVSASPFTVREDPNDEPRGWDIRRVMTRTTPTRVVLWIGMWDRLGRRGGGHAIVVSMDTRGDGTPEVGVWIRRKVVGFKCEIERWFTGGEIGRGDARMRTDRSISCKFPLEWLNIRKAVRFRIEVCCRGDGDLAPDRREYVGL
jgi:hypothetical protein